MATKAPEVIKVKADTERVECRGEGGGLGHPRVFYTFRDTHRITCEYCDREFVRSRS